MPVFKQIVVEARDDYSKGVRVGDRVVLDRTMSSDVLALREGRDYLILNVRREDGAERERKVELYTSIVVGRNLPTPEEKFNQRVEQVVETGKSVQERTHKDVYRQFTKVVTEFSKRDERGYLYPFDIDEAMALEVAQRKDAIWRRVWAIVEGSMEKGRSEGVSWCRAIGAMREECTRALLAPYTNALSRSTSLTSNLVADIEKDAMREFLDVTKYLDVEDLLDMMMEEADE